MTWENYSHYMRFAFTESQRPAGSFSVNEKCFIRKDHKCGKVFGASKSCFIACPTQDDIEPILGLMSEKLTKANIEPIVAVKERAYGQDIFCTKICGRIIESQFCIVILDDAIINGQSIPNPNVYYEYGLMTALRKHIVPLQKEDLRLAFNIQSYDTIKYNARNVTSEIDRGVRDAIKITESKGAEPKQRSMSDKALLRRLELAGFEPKDDDWFLSDVIDDTSFKGFGHHTKGFYLYLGKVDTEADFQDYIEDLGVVLYRTENKFKEVLKEKETYGLRVQQVEESVEHEKAHMGVRVARAATSRVLTEAQKSLTSVSERISMMEKMHIGFIVNPQLEVQDFISQITPIAEGHPRFELCFGHENSIVFGDLQVNLAGPVH